MKSTSARKKAFGFRNVILACKCPVAASKWSRYAKVAKSRCRRGSTTVLWFLFLAFLPNVFAQDIALLKPGPLGRPLLVRDEGGAWEVPISVYSDSDIELMVSDTLTLAGVYWDGPEFKKEGKYQTYIYTFYKNDNNCRYHRIPAGHATDPKWLKACAELRYNRRLVMVDTRNKTVTIVQGILMESDAVPHPELMSFQRVAEPLDRGLNPALFQAINRITAMIEQEINRQPER